MNSVKHDVLRRFRLTRIVGDNNNSQLEIASNLDVNIHSKRVKITLSVITKHFNVSEEELLGAIRGLISDSKILAKTVIGEAVKTNQLEFDFTELEPSEMGQPESDSDN